MLNRYKIVIGSVLQDNTITIPFGQTITPKVDDATDDFIPDILQTFINPIVSGEQEAYSPISDYELIFNFYSAGTFASNWEYAGFNMPEDGTKNIFTKSLFLLEFYQGDGLNSNVYEFSTTLSVYPNSMTGKGSDGLTASTYTTLSGANEMYYIFYDRDISTSPILTTVNSGTSYVSLYMKAMFLNAETGLVQYFITDTSGILSQSQFNGSLYFYEIRFFNDLTYGFYQNDILQTQVIFNELVIQ